MKKISSSFRDPSGFMYEESGIYYRAINHSYREEYDALVAESFFQKLMKTGMLIQHEEHENVSQEFYKILKPTQLPMISYPYEWSFSQLKDAALLTLDIQDFSIKSGFTLKDANGFNVQFFEGKPIWIDSLSFERYRPGIPWVAYGQFIRHFYSPLLLMTYVDLSLNQLLKIHLDGIPLKLVSDLLPAKTRFYPNILTHIHLHSKFEKMYADSKISEKKEAKLSKSNLLAMIAHLREGINKLELKKQSTEWSHYNGETSYSQESMDSKKNILQKLCTGLQIKKVWDLGANDGTYSRIFSNQGFSTVAFDLDPLAVEKNYLKTKGSQEKALLPLIMDLVNPSPAVGWGNIERMSLKERAPVDLVISLAILHHLCLSKNITFEMLAKFLSELTFQIIIEFIPKDDPLAQKLLASREDIFHDYSEEKFEETFLKYFLISQKERIAGSKRIIYLMRKG